jgi:hypothetical protein
MRENSGRPSTGLDGAELTTKPPAVERPGAPSWKGITLRQRTVLGTLTGATSTQLDSLPLRLDFSHCAADRSIGDVGLDMGLDLTTC